MPDDGEYLNPILTGFNPDPSIVRVEKDYFLITSSFEYFPGVPIYHSTDLIKWDLIGHALTRRSQLELRTVEPSAGVWAPTLRYRNGTFYVITGKFDRYRPADDDRVFPRGFYVHTTNIWDSNSWSDPVYFDNHGFDQDLFWDDDGKVYLSSTYRMANRPPNSKLKDFAIHISEIDLLTGRTLTAPQVIKSSPSGVAEGSHIMKKDGCYYLFTAEGGTESGHQECVSRATTGPYGPWERAPNTPLWYNGPDENVQNTGHADLVDDGQGRWFAVLLGVRPRSRDAGKVASQLGRETFLVPVEWKDGWPIFNYGNNIALKGRAPGLYTLPRQAEWIDNFSQKDGTAYAVTLYSKCAYTHAAIGELICNLVTDNLALGWYHKNTPQKKEYSLSARPGFLRLYGGPYSLTSPESPTAVFRKQTAFRCTWMTELHFDPVKDGYEAGTAVWWNHFFHASISVKRIDGKRHIHFQRPETALSAYEVSTVPLTSDTPVTLVIRGVDLGYMLGYADADSENIAWMGEVSTRFLTQAPPLGGSFTGVMFGLFSQACLEPNLSPADFAYARLVNEADDE